jgi:hypothetical protein
VAGPLSDGQIEILSGDELLKLEARLRPHINEGTDYARLLCWPDVDGGRATGQSFRRNHAGAGAADLIIRPDMNQYEAEHAYDLDPWHPLVYLAWSF